MSIQSLEKYLPQNTLQYLRVWFSDYYIHIKVTRNRNSKLGDYRKLPDNSHEITVNSTLTPQLFFFVLTHELAHLIAFERYGRRISPHGNEWKVTFRNMLLESLEVYDEDLKPIIVKFSKSPKANFMASPDLVRYFHTEKQDDSLLFIEELEKGEFFIYRNEKYLLEGLVKKNYLCKNLATGRKYSFKPLARVEKCS
ncbi:SprT-like domain-containing protein [Chryseobacterium gallinarum]|uniref:Transcription elongation protein SprT n=1 Tax=Chryseobacterium gallinarum TaxID=1324352 RepID=A0A0G3M3H2_CHRGL|nr:SprT-like domain-containing protein [Chryseobacterium gallinarum]AKK72553.1 transcription elongation protein SprT [Chryseobacterium gallinarum]MCL8536169.1 SprT-like domain-containing protein [Chryseobacterium gallinarum]QIY91713.1 transcription elongation protein SprT [Chryseobacterium gallinarum]